jgi:hypothetical protein
MSKRKSTIAKAIEGEAPIGADTPVTTPATTPAPGTKKTVPGAKKKAPGRPAGGTPPATPPPAPAQKTPGDRNDLSI